MGYNRMIRGQFDHLEVTGESVQVQGTVGGATIGPGGHLYVQGTVGPGETVIGAGGMLRVDGVLAQAKVTIEEEGQAVMQGVLLGSIDNSGGLVVNAAQPGSELTVSGPGVVLPWEELDEETKRMLPAVEIETSVKRT